MNDISSIRRIEALLVAAFALVCAPAQASAMQGGIALTFIKVLAVKPGFQIDNPSELRELRDVRASARPGVAR